MDLTRPLIILLLILHAQDALAKTTQNNQLNVVALSHTSFIQHNKKGAIDFMLKDLSKKAGIIHQYEVTSHKRGERKFKVKTADCILPTEINNTFSHSSAIIHSKPFASIDYFAFNTHSQRFIKQVQQLDGKLIGIVKNSSRLPIKLPQANFIEVNDVDALTQLLKKKRVDIGIYHQYDLMNAELINLDEQSENKPQPIYTADLGVTCHNTLLSQKYIKKVNPFFERFQKKGLATFYQRSLQNNNE